MPLFFGLSATELLEVFSAILTVLAPLTKLTGASDARPRRLLSLTSGQRILVCFASLVFVFGAVTVWTYRASIAADREAMFTGLWLFMTMVFGMFAQVMVSNHQNGRDLFEVSAQQLILPLLFSIVVYYSIWTVATSAPCSKTTLFPFYAAFLNGYFWRNVIAGAKPTTESEIVPEIPPAV